MAAGELVYSALTTGGNPGSVTPGSTQNVTFTARASTSSGTAYEQDVTSAAAGAQQGTATLGNATDWYAVAATFVPSGGGSGGGGSGGSTATFQQGAAFASGTRATSQTFTLSRPVHAGDLLVGWFAQYNVSGQVTVSDNLNGAWARAPGSLTFQSDTGDIAMYYLPNSKASASGLTITVSAPAPAYLQGTAAEYSGVAVAGPLDQLASGRGVGTAVNTGSTASVAAGELVYSAIVTGSAPGSVTPGTGYTTRAPDLERVLLRAGHPFVDRGSADGHGHTRHIGRLVRRRRDVPCQPQRHQPAGSAKRPEQTQRGRQPRRADLVTRQR